jgi:HSP90 family molecular chaperone
MRTREVLVLLLHTVSEELTSFDEYVERMKPEQKGIYWISGEIQDAIVMSPMLEHHQQKGIEALFLINHINKY